MTIPAEVARILIVDNHDSFVHTLASYLRELGARVELVEADELIPAEAAGSLAEVDGVLVSPGPGHPADVPASTAIVHAAVEAGVPLLGVCLGHQVLAEAFGGRVSEAPELVHGRTSQVHHSGDPLFVGLADPFTAMRYHSLAVESGSVPLELAVTATTPEGVVMGLRHRSAPAWGVQFHPESVLSEGGHRLLANWLAEVDHARSGMRSGEPVPTQVYDRDQPEQ